VGVYSGPYADQYPSSPIKAFDLAEVEKQRKGSSRSRRFRYAIRIAHFLFWGEEPPLMRHVSSALQQKRVVYVGASVSASCCGVSEILENRQRPRGASLAHANGDRLERFGRSG
jgi:hypothetical protein